MRLRNRCGRLCVSAALGGGGIHYQHLHFLQSPVSLLRRAFRILHWTATLGGGGIHYQHLHFLQSLRWTLSLTRLSVSRYFPIAEGNVLELGLSDCWVFRCPNFASFGCPVPPPYLHTIPPGTESSVCEPASCSVAVRFHGRGDTDCNNVPLPRFSHDTADGLAGFLAACKSWYDCHGSRWFDF